MKNLKAKVVTKEYDLDGDVVEIRKMKMKQIKAIQSAVAAIDKDDEEFQILSVYEILRQGVIGAEDMTTEDFEEFNPKDLVELSAEIMIYAGVDLDRVDDEGNSQMKND